MEYFFNNKSFGSFNYFIIYTRQVGQVRAISNNNPRQQILFL